MYKLININDVNEGMELAEPIFNSQGQILLPAGITLNNNHLKILRSWNVLYIKIVTDGQNAEEINISPELLQYARERISKIVNWTPNSEIEEELLEVAVIQLAISKLKSTE
jgi:hypothetical protein